MSDPRSDFAATLMKVSPAAAGSGTALTLSHSTETILGLSANQWAIAVSILTACFVLAQFAHLVWKWRREARAP
ncbi:MAG: hypothetical protein ACPHN2_08580 [Sinimarinibacterium flocculans]|uniref:hypothetical protein n=1 Tax=Sinimarinibacterium flocculans TaxID=985250 RepID=UPI003C423D50